MPLFLCGPTRRPAPIPISCGRSVLACRPGWCGWSRAGRACWCPSPTSRYASQHDLSWACQSWRCLPTHSAQRDPTPSARANMLADVHAGPGAAEPCPARAGHGAGRAPGGDAGAAARTVLWLVDRSAGAPVRPILAPTPACTCVPTMHVVAHLYGLPMRLTLCEPAMRPWDSRPLSPPRLQTLLSPTGLNSVSLQAETQVGRAHACGAEAHACIRRCMHACTCAARQSSAAVSHTDFIRTL